MLGNSFVNPYSNFLVATQALYGHGLLPRPVMQAWREVCANRGAWESKECKKAMETTHEIVASGFHVYALDFPIYKSITMPYSANEKNMRVAN
mmetsp:Transcript_20346/g.38545  ORF Transcript_20346/g.38545 Transcript_20346/m.38545 type:complete len:93 (+) Transcript_20346:963-1241(+)